MGPYAVPYSLNEEFAAGRSPSSPERARATNAADDMARANGHDLGDWRPYGRANVKAQCVRCGAEARVPFSAQTNGYRDPVGAAVHPLGQCSPRRY